MTLYYEKSEALLTLLQLQRQGYRLSQNFSMKNSLEDLEAEIDRLTAVTYNNYGLELALAMVGSYVFSIGILLPVLKMISQE